MARTTNKLKQKSVLVELAGTISFIDYQYTEAVAELQSDTYEEK